DADRPGVAARDMGADLADRPTFYHAAVAIDDIVVADVRPTALFVPGADVGNGEILAFWRRRAVDDDLVDRPHGVIEAKTVRIGRPLADCNAPLWRWHDVLHRRLVGLRPSG